MSDLRFPRHKKATSRWRIEVKRPHWGGSGPNDRATSMTEELIYCFTGGETVVVDTPRISQTGTPVTSFNYGNSLTDPAPGFSMTLLPYDDYTKKIALHDTVYFYDDTYGDATAPEFIGLVQDRRYTSRMTASGAVRGITIAGKSLAALVTEYSFVIDYRIFGAVSGKAKSDALQANLQALQPAKSSYKGTAESLVLSFSEVIAAITKSYAGIVNFYAYRLEIKDYDAVTLYPKIFSLYNVGNNTLFDLLRNMADPPWNETFFTFKGDKLVFNIRPTPYLTPDDWKKREKYEIDPLYITGIDVGNSTAECYTVFSTTFPGSMMDANKTMAIDEYRETVKMSSDINKYGYRSMQIERTFLNRDKEPDGAVFDVKTVMTTSNEQLAAMYLNADKMTSGTIQTMPLPPDDAHHLPVIGERVSVAGLQGVEFYVEGISRSWQVGSSFGATIRVSRGGVYDNGKWVGPVSSADVMGKIG